YALLADAHLTEIAEAGAIYSELIVSPDQGDAVGIGADAHVRGLAEGAERAKAKTGIETRLLIVGIRHFGAERVVKAAEYAARRPHPLVTGFNLAGEERMHSVADFTRAFDIARAAGLGITIRPREPSGAFSRRHALDHVRPPRLSHRVPAVEGG